MYFLPSFTLNTIGKEGYMNSIVENQKVEIKDFLRDFYNFLLGNNIDCHIGIIKYSENRGLFHLDHFFKDGMWAEGGTFFLEDLFPSNRQCFLERREVIILNESSPSSAEKITPAYNSMRSFYSFPIIIEGDFFAIFTVKVKNVNFFKGKILDQFRLVSKMIKLHYEKEMEKKSLLVTKEVLEDTAHTLDLVTKISEIIVSTNSIKEISINLYHEMKGVFGECTIGLAINSEEHHRLEDCFYYEYDNCLEFDNINYSELKNSRLVEAVVNDREYINEGFSPHNIMGASPLASYFVPLKMDKKVIGVFTYQIYHRSKFLKKEIDLCRRLISFLTIALNNTIQNKKIMETNRLLEIHSTIDDLTGVYTRRHFYKVFEEDLSSKRGVNLRSFLLLIDLDNFKGVNDNFGHTSGDIALKKIAGLLKESFPTGVIGRYGGDEFLGGIIGGTYTDISQAVQLLIDRVDKLNIPYDKQGNTVGLSVGILEITSDKPLREYFPQLDANLYRAKVTKEGYIFSKSYA